MVTAPPEVPLEDGVHQAGRRHVDAWGYSESRSHLTPREEQILQFVAHGWSAKEIARHIAIAPRTVERHIENARLKIGARNTPHMIACAFSTGALDSGAFSPEAVGELFGVEFGDNFPIIMTSRRPNRAKGRVFPNINSQERMGVTMICSSVPISLSLTIA